MIVSILILLAAWLWLWLVMLGWGAIACRLARCDRPDKVSLLVTPWIGVACVVAFLQVWHLAAPINGWPFAIVSSIGVIGTATLARQQLRQMATQAMSYRVATALRPDCTDNSAADILGGCLPIEMSTPAAG